MQTVLAQARKERSVIIMYSVFGDESHDEKAKRTYTVAGLGGAESEWKSLEAAWNERTGGEIFRPADCEADKGDYKSRPHKENQQLYRDLVRTLARTNIMGYAAISDLQALWHCFPGSEEQKDEWPYFHCFSEVLQHFLRVNYVSIPQERVDFLFHRNLKTEKTGRSLYDYLLDLPEDEWPLKPLLHDLTYTGREDHIGIQAACLFAREAMKHFDNFFIGPRVRRTRASMRALMSTDRYLFFLFDREEYETLKKEWEKLRDQAAVPGEKYGAWLEKHKLQHSYPNGIRYIDYMRRLAQSKTI